MNSDTKLKETLRSWQPNVSLPSNFQRNVWSRIEQESERGKISWLESFLRQFTELMVVPRYATIVAAIVLLVGASLGYVQGGAQANTVWSQLESKYADSINPLAPSHLMANR